VLVGIRAELGWVYYVGLTVASLCFIYQQLLIKHRLPDRCLEAFLNNNYFGMLVFLGIFTHYIISK
ncbi:MAG: 4-hydroxybenzoate octaprenyltransferase, partial [Pseudomonadota bacterium]